MSDNKIKELKGTNTDIDLTTIQKNISWKQDKCPWNEAKKNNRHKCAVKNVSLCKYFRGIKCPDIVICNYKTTR